MTLLTHCSSQPPGGPGRMLSGRTFWRYGPFPASAASVVQESTYRLELHDRLRNHDMESIKLGPNLGQGLVMFITVPGPRFQGFH